MEVSSLAYDMEKGDIAAALGGAGCSAKSYGFGLPECSLILSGGGGKIFKIIHVFLAFDFLISRKASQACRGGSSLEPHQMT